MSGWAPKAAVTVDDPDDSELIWQIRGQLVIESRRLGLEAPIDGIFSRLDDDEGLRRVCERVMGMGYSGKLLIHPGQIAVAASVFVPKPETLEQARDVMAVYDESKGISGAVCPDERVGAC